MKIPKDVANQVIEGKMEELYNVFVTLEEEYPLWEEDYEMVRYGIQIPFEIQDLWENTTTIKISAKNGHVIIGNRKFNMSEFRSEKEGRRKIMAEAINENIDLVSPTTLRG
jgi:hypothetical protein